jgi:large subunit ribosomal protein L10
LSAFLRSFLFKNMPRTKEEKAEIIKQLGERAQKQESMVFANFKGLNMDNFSELRGELKKGGAEMVVCKKSLLGLAFKESKIDLDIETLSGEIAVIFGYSDPMLPIKTVYDFSKKVPGLKIVGGYAERLVRSGEEMEMLAKIPSRQELLGNLVGTIQAPISSFASVLQGNIRGLLQVLSQVKV